MCYNYSLTTFPTIEEYNATFKKGVRFQKKFYVNSYSLPKMPVITNEDHNYFQLYYWGLIPFWSKKIEDAEKIRNKTMNARAETIFEKPSFRNSIKNKRCLVLSDGFFEWRYILGKNYPYYIHLNNRKIFSFAGIWDCWKNPENDEFIYTYSIITCEPNKLLKKIHNKKKRMPVILPKQYEMCWLADDLNENEIKKFLVPYPDEEMAAYTISRLITSKNRNRNVSKVIEYYNYSELEGIE